MQLAQSCYGASRVTPGFLAVRRPRKVTTPPSISPPLAVSLPAQRRQVPKTGSQEALGLKRYIENLPKNCLISGSNSSSGFTLKAGSNAA